MNSTKNNTINLKKIIINIEKYRQIKKQLPNEFSETLIYHKIRLNLTINELAQRTSINEKYISQFLSKKRKPTNLEVITLALGMNLSYLLTIDLLTKANYTLDTIGEENYIIMEILINYYQLDLEIITENIREIEKIFEIIFCKIGKIFPILLAKYT